MQGVSSVVEMKPTAPSGSSTDGQQLFVIPLKEVYEEENFNFLSLRGRDHQLAYILQAIDFIDVHVAIIECSLLCNPSVIEVQNRQCNEVYQSSSRFQIVKWFYGNNSIPQFTNYYLDLAKNLVGTSLPTFRNSPTNNRETYHYPAIVIQPRSQSVRHCCIHRFDAVLFHLNVRLLTDVNMSQRRRLPSLKCLGQIIQYCREEPSKVWDDVTTRLSEKRTTRLLNFCQKLKAQKEGLQLVEFLGKKSINTAFGGLFYVGIRSIAVARSIVDMLVNTGGIISNYFSNDFNIKFYNLLYRLASVCCLSTGVDQSQSSSRTTEEFGHYYCRFGRKRLRSRGSRCSASNLFYHRRE